MTYLDTKRTELNRLYKNIETFKSRFNVSEELLQELITLASNEKVEFNEEQYAKSKPLIALQIKALIARDLFDLNEYFQIINDENQSLKEAVRVINDQAEYNRILGL
jgi:carboxyl-terminal processing protease